MIDRNSDLRAFQARARELCGGEFVTAEAFAAAMGLARDKTKTYLRGLPKLGYKYWVDDAAERVFEELHPKAKRAG